MPPEKDETILQSLLVRYWFPLMERCNSILRSTVAAEEVSRQALARLATQIDEGAEDKEWLEVLYRDSTQACLERLSGRKGRDTQWLGHLERQAQATSEDEPLEPQREQVLDLLGRTVPENRPAVVMRYLEGLSLDSVAQLTGQTREQAKAQLDGFNEKANAFLENRGDPLLKAPDEPDCPDSFSLYRLLSGERSGLEEVRTHLDDHPECAQGLQALEKARDEAIREPDPIVQALAQNVARLQRKRPGHRLSARQLALPALAVALAIGLIAWMSGPETMDPQDNPLTNQKGYSIEAFVLNGEDQEFLVPGQEVPAGTTLHFRLGSISPMRVRLNALRERGPVIPIGPPEQLTWSLHPAELVVPPHKHRLGEGPGLERIFVMYCPLGGPLGYFAQGLTYAFQPGLDGKRDLARDYSSAPRNCQIRSLILRRTAEPAK